MTKIEHKDGSTVEQSFLYASDCLASPALTMVSYTRFQDCPIPGEARQLPMLISGELRVPSVEVVVEEVC